MLNAVYTMCYMDVLAECPTLLENIVWDTPEHTDKLKEMLYAKYFNKEISGETIGEQKLFMEQKFIQYRDYYTEMLEAYETSIEWLDGEITTYSEEGEYSESTSESTSDDTDITHGHTETHSGEDERIIAHGHTETDSGTDTKTETKEISTTTTTTRTEEVTTTQYDLPRSATSENHPSRIVTEKPDGQENTVVVTPSTGEDISELAHGKVTTHSGTDTDTLEHGHVITHGGKDSTERDVSKSGSKSGSDNRSHTAKVADLIRQKERYLALIRNLFSEFADKFSPCFIDMYS